MLTIIEDKPKLVLGAEKWQAAPFRFLDNLQVFNDIPSWQDIVLSGNTALTLTNAKANSLNYLKLFGGTVQNGTPSPDTPIDIVCNNGVVKANKNLYWTEYYGYHLSQSDGITVSANGGVNVSGMVDCRTIKSFKITTTSPQGSFRIFKYGADNTFINATSTGNMGDIVTLGYNVGFFRIQYNFTSGGTGTENILIYNSAHNLDSIYTDGTTETVEITGKNLFDKSAVTVGYMYDSSGNYTSSNNVLLTDWIKVEPSTTYVMTTPVAENKIYGANRYINYFDENKTWLSQTLDILQSQVQIVRTFTTSANTKYIRLSWATGASNYAIDSNASQIEQGSTATEYEPYFDGGTATAENLFKVGDYQDIQSVIDGGVTRNVGIKVLDGTEGWKYSSGYSDTNTGCFYYNETNIKGQTQTSIECYCSHFEWTSRNDMIAFKTKICGAVTGASDAIGSLGKAITLRVPSTILNSTSPSDFKQWLSDQYNAGTPVIIVYPLAEPTTETVTPQPMSINAGTNIVQITQASMDNLELEVSYKATI